MKTRGLNKDLIQLGIMDGFPGFMKVFREEFPHARVQRCQVHVTRNVLCKVSSALKSEVKDNLRDIFNARSRSTALSAYQKFVSIYEPKVPSAVKSLSNVINECLTLNCLHKFLDTTLFLFPLEVQHER